jgi:hypothetical protein
LESIDEYDKQVREYLGTTTCECCKTYPAFLLGVNDDLKILCLTKMSRQEQDCPTEIRKLTRFEGMVKLRIKNKLDCVMEKTEEVKEEIHDGKYLNTMNDLKWLNDFVSVLDEADTEN